MRKKVLVITFYWPPAGGIAVLRWLQFSRYLPEFGWDPIIYTAKDAAYPMIEEGLNDLVDPDKISVIRQPIWEPYKLYKSFTGMKKDKKVQDMLVSENKKKGWKEKFGLWVRANFFIPDARKFWINPSIKFLENYLKNEKVDLIVSNGPPHSMHLIGMGLKKKTGIPWIADFRDPWSKIDYYHHLPLTRWADKKHKLLEKKVLSTADLVTSHSWTTGEDFKNIGGGRVEIVTNGYDENDFQPIPHPTFEKFEITHVGSINADRDTPLLWEVLDEICSANPAFKNDLAIKLVGKIDISTKQTISRYNIENLVTYIDFVAHKDACKIMQESTLLLLLLKRIPTIQAVIPGKIFEYLASQRPILCIGHDHGDSARIINESDAGIAINHDEKAPLKEAILQFYKLYKEERLYGSNNYKNYARRSITERYASLMNKVLNQEIQ
ncbi:MAG: glycosyltransferase [Bacteroidota bacterium]